jgi:UDP-N-acetylglucosamine 2-epimerase (non-hydrolysing)
MKTAIVMGTRPEIIKLAPIIKKIPRSSSIVIFTGQHYDYEMSLQFIDQLGIKKPDYTMKLKKLQNTTTDRATQIGEIMINLGKIFTKENPDTVIVQGDTNTVLSSAISSIKCNIPVSHVESGLRSYDWRMPEEHNRIAVDHISEFLFAPTSFNKSTLKKEKVHGKIYVTGNTSIDAVCENLHQIKKVITISDDFDDFVLLTLHRSENVDDKKILSSIVKGLIDSKTKIVFPLHPRTLKKLKEFNLYHKIENSKNFMILPPVGYFDMLYLMKKCNIIVTDSGGIQEETTSPGIQKKVLLLRTSTERIESVQAGFVDIIGINSLKITKSILKNFEKSHKFLKNPYGNGKSSTKIIETLKKNF